MIVAACLYGLCVLWLAFEAHNAPLLPDPELERFLQPVEGGSHTGVAAFVPDHLSHHAAGATR